MNQQLVPQSPMTPASPADMAQQLVQALSMIASTQQQILNKLSAPQQVSPPSRLNRIIPFFSYASKPDQYDWLYNYGLHYNLDGTPKTQAITAEDVKQHQEMLNAYWAAYNCKR